MLDRAIIMALRRQMQNEVNAFEGRADRGAITDVSPNEPEFGVMVEFRDGFAMARIGQRVEHHKLVVGVVRNPIVGEVRPDESGAAGEEYLHTASDRRTRLLRFPSVGVRRRRASRVPRRAAPD